MDNEENNNQPVPEGNPAGADENVPNEGAGNQPAENQPEGNDQQIPEANPHQDEAENQEIPKELQ